MLHRLTICLSLLLAFPAWAAGGYHPPHTEAEKTLDRVIHRAQDDPLLSRYMLLHSSVDELREAQTRDMFTPALLEALQDSEANMVHMRCGGRYIPGQQCGISYNPITCLEFERPEYLYRTDSYGEYSNGQANAVLTYRLPEGSQIIATYNMIKVDGKWKIDGIECTVGGNFNM